MSMFRRKARWPLFAALVLLLGGLIACDVEPPPIDPGVNTPKKGQTDFSTTEMGGNGYGTAERGGIADSQGAPSAAPGAPSASNDSANKTAPSGRTGTVEEADLYRVSGTKLFYLNTYKGLTIFNLKDTKNPKKLSNLPVFGYPIEMFVQNNLVYALVKDAMYLLRVNGKFEFQRRYVSQLVTIDISNPSQPIVLQRLDIEGQLREGVSRKIENTIYVVSYTPRNYYYGWSYQARQNKPEQATVYSFNIKNPSAVRMVQKLDLIQHPATQNNTNTNNGNTPSTTTSQNRSFSGVTISATANTLLVGEKWYHYSYSRDASGCGRSENYQETVMSIVDISDETGKINVHTRFKIRGELGDQFKQTYIYDEKTNKGTYLGIFRRQEWKYVNCQSQRTVRNTLVSIDISDGDNPKLLDEKIFGKPNETVRGSLFDRDRKVVYAITAVRTDPLYAISFKDPSKLQILSEVDGLSGDINVFRFIGENKFLLAVGRDNSSTCSGFGSDRVGTKVAVSIIDVRDLNKVRLVQRKCVDIQGGKWSSSEINWNLDQAHKMLGMYSDGKGTNLLTLPVSYHTRTTSNRWWYYEYKSAIGIMKWDLSKYDDTKDETQQNVLENVATMQHPKGAVKRTIVTNLPQGNGQKRVVINLSDTHMSLVDLDNLQKPEIISTYEIAPYVRSVYRFGNYLLEQVGMGTGGYYDDFNQFRVKAIGKTNPNDAKILADFKVGRIQKVVRWNNLLLLFRYHFDVAKSLQYKRAYYDHSKSDLLIVDMSNPLKPREAGSVTLPYAFIPHYFFFCGTGFYYDFGYYYSNNSFVKTDTGLTSLYSSYANNSQTTKLFFLDLSDADNPSYKEKVLSTYNYNQKNNTTSRQFFQLVRLDGKRFYLSNRTYKRTYQSNGNSFTSYKFYAQPWSLKGKNWSAGSHINVPGRLVKAFRNGNKVSLLTQDTAYIRHPYQQYNSYRYQNVTRLYLLEEDGNLARLKDFHVFKSWYLRNLLIDGDKLYMTARRDWYYLEIQRNKAGQTTSELDNGDHLLIFNLKNNVFKQEFAKPTRTYNMQLMGIQKGRLFINLPGEGLLVTDVKNTTTPKGLHFERTLGWSSHVEFDGDYALIAAGHFGIYHVDLTQTTIPAL